MSRWLSRICLFAFAIGVVLLVLETRRLAELAGSFELEAISVRRQLAEIAQAQAQAAADGASAPARSAAATAHQPPGPSGGVELGTYTQQLLELHDTRKRLAAVTELLEQRNAELERRAEAAEEAASRALQPIPEGVRSCLDGLHECLRAEGFVQQRFLRAAALDDEGLHDVELLDADDDGLSVAFLHAARMTARVDRDLGQLELRFFDGHRTADGERAELPEDGWPLLFRDIDGRLFERRLPFLVRGDGAYPAEVEEPARPATDVDAGTRRQWLRRIEQVLAEAGTDKRWRATRLRGMQDGWFLAVELVGTNDKSLVLASAHCERVAIEVDEESGVVSLWMQDGVLRQDGVESTITGEGYRMLLPGLTPRQAIDAMFGMVVRK